jgi:hypothetical protein
VNPAVSACDVTCYDGEEAKSRIASLPSFILKNFRAISVEPSLAGTKRGYSVQLTARRLSLTKKTQLLLWFGDAEVERLQISVGKGADVAGEIDIVIALTHGHIQLRRNNASGIGLISSVINAVFFRTEHIWINM